MCDTCLRRKRVRSSPERSTTSATWTRPSSRPLIQWRLVCKCVLLDKITFSYDYWRLSLFFSVSLQVPWSLSTAGVDSGCEPASLQWLGMMAYQLTKLVMSPSWPTYESSSRTMALSKTSQYRGRDVFDAFVKKGWIWMSFFFFFSKLCLNSTRWLVWELCLNPDL